MIYNYHKFIEELKMNNQISILLVEDDTNTCLEFRNCLDSVDNMDLVGSTGNVNEALEMVQAFLPSVIILDLELHLGGGNGLLFLHHLKQFSYRPYIIITTNNTSIVTLDATRQLGADFILTKYEAGYSVQYVIDFISAIKTTLLTHEQSAPPQPALPPVQQERKVMQRIHRELDLVGISPKAIGFRYLADAIFYVMRENEAYHLSTILAHKYQKTYTSIERAMQNAINRAWQTNDPEELLCHYTAKIRSDRGVPTLMEFVSYYAIRLRTSIE